MWRVALWAMGPLLLEWSMIPVDSSEASGREDCESLVGAACRYGSRTIGRRQRGNAGRGRSDTEVTEASWIERRPTRTTGVAKGERAGGCTSRATKIARVIPGARDVVRRARGDRASARGRVGGRQDAAELGGLVRPRKRSKSQSNRNLENCWSSLTCL
jgi:hypothetical protein